MLATVMGLWHAVVYYSWNAEEELPYGPEFLYAIVLAKCCFLGLLNVVNMVVVSETACLFTNFPWTGHSRLHGCSHVQLKKTSSILVTPGLRKKLNAFSYVCQDQFTHIQ